MSATCTDAGCLCVPTEPLTIHGIGVEGDRIWFAREDEVWATFHELATMRKAITAPTSGGTLDFWGTRLDESDLSALITAMRGHVTGERLLPVWPLEICVHCGVDAVARIEGAFLCHPHTEGFTRREDEAS